MKKIAVLLFTVSILLLGFTKTVFAYDKGIYINQATLENQGKLNRLIEQAKATGINTFIVDLKTNTRNYGKNIKKIKSHGIKYVARIVIFPKGGKASQVKSKQYWDKKYRLIDQAIRHGADEIQLDYIRYSTKQRPSKQNADDIHKVIKYYKAKVKKHNKPLQIDVFGEASFKPSTRIGQDVKLFANTVDAVCPMVYPSHYRPYRYHSQRPYETINKSLKAMRKQFNNNPPFRIIPYIEATNFRYKMSHSKKQKYILEQIRAVEDNSSKGWYVWSANNHYDALFSALKLSPSEMKNYQKNQVIDLPASKNKSAKSKSNNRKVKAQINLKNYKKSTSTKKWYER